MKKNFCKIIVAASIFIAVFAIIIYFSGCGGFSFQKYTNNVFRNEVSGDVLSLHYSLAEPLGYDIDKKEAPLPSFSFDKEIMSYAKTENYLTALASFDTEYLSDDEEYTYHLLSKKLTQALKGNSFFYHKEVFSPSGGIQGQYPILMADFSFRKKEDIDCYLSILENTPHYFESLMEFEKEKSKRGFFMSDYSLLKVIEQCSSTVTSKALNEKTHFLQSTFQERISKAVSDNVISTTEAKIYIKKNQEVLWDYVLPAYKQLGKSLSLLRGTGKNEAGLFYYPNGSAYYKWLFIETTGSHTDLDTVYQKLSSDYYKNLNALIDNLKQFQDSCELTEENIDYFPLSKPEDMVAHLNQKMGEDFPAISSIVPQPQPKLSVKEVSSTMEAYTAPAYYLVPPIDEPSQNTIYINKGAKADGIHLYTTLAHEGYPGHLYQTVYYQVYQDAKQDSPIRSILNYGGYVEGWALYTELYSFDYAKELLKEKTGQDSYSILYTLYEKERKSQLALLSLLDIGIHYYGMTFDRVYEILSAYGITDKAQARKIFEYIVEEPATYPKYYWGYLEIEKLKELAKKKWRYSYSDYRFHQFILQAGPSDFENLNRRLQRTK